MTEKERMAELLLPHIDQKIEDYQRLYPERDLPQGARVTRIAPSPTGYLHLGVLFMALVNRLSAGENGIFFARIEDTDKKREVEGGVADILDGLRRFGVAIDEGYVGAGEQTGAYGPYLQSERAPIYQAFAKELVRRGLAYPCFCTEGELAQVRAEQEAKKLRTGYYGPYARHRDITYEQAKKNIEQGLPFVLRLKSPGNERNRISFDDGIKGKIEMPENDEDFVLLKSDGIPTYHFAHVVDDYLMRTTHVIRGDEWISSTPKHLQLFRLFGFKPPEYAHVAPLLKSVDGAKRKISKRKDPEAAVRYFLEQGYEPQSVMEYLMTILSADFEPWRRANQDRPYGAFAFALKKMSISGALFDADKLRDISKNVIAGMRADEVVRKLMDWAKRYDKPFYELLAADPAYTEAIFAIDRGGKKPRKDLAKWDEAKDFCSYFFDTLYQADYALPAHLSPADATAFLRAYLPVYDPTDEREAWFSKIKLLCPALGFAQDVKAYKADPTPFKGHVGDLSTVLRVAITGRQNTPDLCQIMRLLGRERCLRRMRAAIQQFEEEQNGID